MVKDWKRVLAEGVLIRELRSYPWNLIQIILAKESAERKLTGGRSPDGLVSGIPVKLSRHA